MRTPGSGRKALDISADPATWAIVQAVAERFGLANAKVAHKVAMIALVKYFDNQSAVANLFGLRRNTVHDVVRKADDSTDALAAEVVIRAMQEAP